MKRILSGVQPSGNPHIGNYFGAMKNNIEMSSKFESYIFIADLHSLTTVRNPKKLQESIIELAIDYLALGLDPDKCALFRQSDVPEHAELAWILSTVTPMGLLERAHAFKDATAKGKKDSTAGLFTYPVLMAADILLYKPDLVPVGKDQKQHIEIAQDIAEKFDHYYSPTFKRPEPYIPEEVAVIPGTDGEKMSKSYNNTIDIFADEALLKKQVMGIKTDSTPLEEPKDPTNDIIFNLYKLFADKKELEELRDKYTAGGFGYGDAKKILHAKIVEYFSDARKKRIELKKNLSYVNDVLRAGAEKARKVARNTMQEVRQKTGLSS